MMSRVLVSIVINNFNYGRFLRDAIDSALSQTYSATEVIVVDDGSTDDSREIVTSYGRRITPILKVNGGQASALNAGIAQSSGDIVCFLDSDDVFLPNKVERIIEAASFYPRAGLLYHRIQPVSETLRAFGKIFPHRVFRGNIADRVRKSAGFWAAPPTSGLSFRRNVLQQIGPVPEAEFQICADAYLTYLIPVLTEVVGIEDVLTLYRAHGQNRFNDFKSLRDKRQEFLKQQLQRYETTVASVNQCLQRMEMNCILDIKNHLGHRYCAFLTEGDRARLSRLMFLMCKGLFHAGEPSKMVRVKASINFGLRFAQVKRQG